MDIISSFKSFLSTWILPDTTGAWGAVGTVGTCTAAGFFGQGASIASPLYNGSLALFYLLTIRYGWKDESSQFSRIEPLMHGIPLVFGWGTAIAGLPLKLYNPIGWTCWIAEVPRGCDRDSSVPCERGDNSYIYRWAFFHAELWLTFFLVAAMMLSMYLSVRDIEQKSNQYRPPGEQRVASKSRRVATQSFLYVLAYFVTWMFPTVTWLTELIQGKTYTPILFLQSFFVPLQGFFNAFIYIRPRYERYRRSMPTESRWRVMISAIRSGFRINDEKKVDQQKSSSVDLNPFTESITRKGTFLRRLSIALSTNGHGREKGRGSSLVGENDKGEAHETYKNTKLESIHASCIDMEGGEEVNVATPPSQAHEPCQHTAPIPMDTSHTSIVDLSHEEVDDDVFE